MLHAVQANQGASPSQASLTMDSNRTRLVLSSREELRDNIIRRGSSIKEVQVQVLDALLGKLVLFVLRLVQTDN